MRSSFARRQLHGLLTSQAFGAGSSLVAGVADMVVAGNFVGIDALSGIAAVLPVVIGAQFVARLVSCGSGYLFAKYQGLLDAKRSRETVGLALTASAAVGLVIFLVTLLGRDCYFELMGLTGAVREQASLYWRWIFIYYSLYPLMQTMWKFVCADGEMVTTAVGGTLSPLLTIALSALFARLTGTAAGVALGVLVGMGMADLVMMLHCLRRSNSVVPSWGFSWWGLKELLSYSLTDSTAKLCQCAFVAVVNRLVIFSASVAYLPVVGMLMLVQQLCDVLDHIGEAYVPLAEMYLGERNVPRLRELAKHSLMIALIVGLGLLVAVELFAPQLVALYGIPPGPVFDHSVIALRFSGGYFPLASALLFLSSHYLVLERIALSVATTIATGFLLTAGGATFCCLIWGLDALWIGLPFGGLLTMGAVVAYCRLFENRGLPLLIPDECASVLNQTLVPEAAKIVEARDAGERFLRLQGVGAETIARLMLLVEECVMAVADGCRQARKVLVEVSIFVDPREVTLVLRDTGAVRDVTDGDAQVTSLRSFVIAGLVSSHENRHYLNTIGCNRTVFAMNRG